MSRKTSLIGDLISHEIGGGWGEEFQSSDFEIAAYVIRGTDIPRALEGDVSTPPLRYHKASTIGGRILRKDDVVFEVSGGSKGQPVGRALLIHDRVLDRFGEKVICASFCKLVRFDHEKCNPRYLFRCLQQAYRSGSLDAFQVQSTGITNFRWKPFLQSFEVELPSLPEQEQIARVLDLLDESIDNSRQKIAQLARTRGRDPSVVAQGRS